MSPGDFGARVTSHVPGWGPFQFGGFGPVTRLIGTDFRFVLLALVACLALVVARRAVEGSAERVADEPLRSTLVGLAAWMLFVPVFMLVAVVLSISIIGIPLLLLEPFAVLFLLLMAVVGFTGTASAVGQWARRRFGIGDDLGDCRCLPGDSDHSPAGAARTFRGARRLDAQPDRVSAGGDRPRRGVPGVVQRIWRGPHQRVFAVAGQARDAPDPASVVRWSLTSAVELWSKTVRTQTP